MKTFYQIRADGGHGRAANLGFTPNEFDSSDAAEKIMRTLPRIGENWTVVQVTIQAPPKPRMVEGFIAARVDELGDVLPMSWTRVYETEEECRKETKNFCNTGTYAFSPAPWKVTLTEVL